MAKGTAVLRARNEKRVLAYLRQHRTTTRQHLADVLDVSKNTISQIVDQLLKQGIVTETGIDQTGVGRPRIEIGLVPDALQAIGVLIRDTHVDLLVTDYCGSVLHQESIPVDAHDDAQCLNVIAESCRHRLLHHQNVVGVGIAIPGMVDPGRGLVHTSTHLGWSKVDVTQRIQACLGDVPVQVLNRVKAAALSPLKVVPDTAGSTFYVRIDDGVGGAFVVGTEILQGASWTAGEIGHVVVAGDGPPCRCGQQGCLESMVSLPAVKTRLLNTAPELLFAIGDAGELEPCTAAESEVWKTTMKDVGSYLGSALAVIVNLLNPEYIVIDGPYQRAPDFRESVLSSVAQKALKHPFESTHIQFVSMPHSAPLGVARAVVLDFENTL